MKKICTAASLVALVAMPAFAQDSVWATASITHTHCLNDEVGTGLATIKSKFGMRPKPQGNLVNVPNAALVMLFRR